MTVRMSEPGVIAFTDDGGYGLARRRKHPHFG